MPLLPKFYRRQLEREDTEHVERIVADAGSSEPGVVLPGARG